MEPLANAHVRQEPVTKHSETQTDNVSMFGAMKQVSRSVICQWQLLVCLRWYVSRYSWLPLLWVLSHTDGAACHQPIWSSSFLAVWECVEHAGDHPPNHLQILQGSMAMWLHCFIVHILESIISQRHCYAAAYCCFCPLQFDIVFSFRTMGRKMVVVAAAAAAAAFQKLMLTLPSL